MLLWQIAVEEKTNTEEQHLVTRNFNKQGNNSTVLFKSDENEQIYKLAMIIFTET